MDAEHARAEARQILESLDKLKMRKADRPLWEALILARWYEARALAPARKIFEADPRAIAAGLGHRGRVAERRALDFVRELYTRSAEGEPVKLWLRPLAEERGLAPEEEKRGARDQGGEKRKGDPAGAREGAQGQALEGDLIPCATRAPRALTPARGVAALGSEGRGLAARAEIVGREVPPPEGTPRAGEAEIGRASAASRGQWVAWVGDVQRHWPAPLRLEDLARMCPAVPRNWLASILGQYREILARGLSEERRRELALGMVGEAEAIAREALRLSAESEDERVKMAALKLGLEALGRRSSLAGLDKISLELRAEVQGARSPEEVARAMGLSPDALSAIGDAASAALSRKEIK